MRKWLPVSLAFLLFSGSGVPLQAEGSEETIHVYVHAAADDTVPCAAAEYGIYTDGQAQHPLMNGQLPVTLKTDQQGRGELTLPSGSFFLKLNTPSAGYYGEETVTPVREEMRLSQWQIRFAFSAGDRIPEMVLQQEDGSCIPLDQAQAGKTYMAVEKDPQKYHAASPVSVEIPVFRKGDSDPLFVQTEDHVYGNAMVQFTAGGKNTAGVKYALFADEACTIPLMDVTEQAASGTSTEEVQTIRLWPGKAYLKILDAPTQYVLQKEVIPFEITGGRDQEIKIPLSSIHMKASVKDMRSGAEVPADFLCLADTSSDEKNQTELERGQTYTLKTKLKADGYFKMADQKITIKEDSASMVEIVLQAVPFDVHINGIDAETGSDVAIKYEIRDASNQPVETLHAGDTVIFYETDREEGYEPSQEKQLSIPAYSEEPMSYEISFAHVPFVMLHAEAPAGTELQLYTDEACSQKAADRFGDNAGGRTDAYGKITFAMHNGIYYLLETDLPKGYCTDAGIRKVFCSRTEGAAVSVSFDNDPISIAVVSTQGGGSFPNAVYEITENGELIATAASTGRDVIQEGIYAGHTYEVSVVSCPGQYLYPKHQSVTIPADGAQQSLTFDYQPYVNLILSTDADAAVHGGLYLSQDGSEQAKDIHNSFCDLILDGTPKTLQVAPGTYWFRSPAASHYYGILKEILIPSDAESNEQILHAQAADFTIEIENEDLHRHTMELRDEEGSLIKTWNAENHAEEIDARRLEPGKSYDIKDKDTGETTTFTLPQQEPSQQPVVKVQQKEKEGDIAEEKEAPKVLWMVTGAAALLAAAGSGLFLHHKRENSFKE